ncbi:tRNA (adenosine(37)-N6)-threonylcarbamoyltransferase complex dimerization subunit type 1 TsaB [Christensenellaceae bacterium OttesenSCG-928-L17]|nr:tRNA (adenosine(37)-N6)-threonylcarbamoyltransferase complex dimerization subunit type 1 TsaB [Christensenellaceae bacterium OttesenSCG-928-L17]
MLILGLETAGPTASVALMRDGKLLIEHTVHHTRTHSETVMPMVEQLMQELHCTADMLNAVACNIGPGSFTGVRIGVCTANAMHTALNIPVTGICSLAALYEKVACYPHEVCAMIDARNDSVYMAVFSSSGEYVQEPSAMNIDACLAMLSNNTLLVGDAVPVYIEKINQYGLPVAPAQCHMSRAASLCVIAEKQLSAFTKSPYTEVEPMYLRPSQAERMFAKKHEQGMEEKHGY